jgi:hypothetical protein
VTDLGREHPMTRQEGIAKMTAKCHGYPLGLLANSLTQLDAKTQLDDAERLARAVMIDVICERCPAADAAFNAWADSDDMDRHSAVAAIVAAAKEGK